MMGRVVCMVCMGSPGILSDPAILSRWRDESFSVKRYICVVSFRGCGVHAILVWAMLCTPRSSLRGVVSRSCDERAMHGAVRNVICSGSVSSVGEEGMPVVSEVVYCKVAIVLRFCICAIFERVDAVVVCVVFEATVSFPMSLCVVGTVTVPCMVYPSFFHSAVSGTSAMRARVPWWFTL